MSASKTHCEQISVELVKKIAEQNISQCEPGALAVQTYKRCNRKDQVLPTAPAQQVTSEALITQQLSGQMNSSEQLQYPQWQEAYRLALLELDSEKLKERVAAAEALIFARRQAIEDDADLRDERHAIQDALSGLQVLKRA
jgi:hypothetical protein